MLSRHIRLVGLVLTLTGVSFAALLGLGWRSLDRFEVAFARALRQACVYIAQEATQQIQRDFKSPVFNLLEQVDHPAIKNFDLPKIAETLRNRPQHFLLIDTFFVWSLVPEKESDPLKTERPLLFYSVLPSPIHRVGDQAPASGYVASNGFFLNPSLAAVLQEEARRFAPLRKNFALRYLTFDTNTYLVVYHFLYDEEDRRLLWGLEGFLVDEKRLREGYFAEVVAAWKHHDAQLPELAMSILDSEGREISRSGRSLLERYEAEAPFAFIFFDTDLLESLSPFQPEVRYWTVRTGYEAGDIDALVQRESRQQRWAWVLVGVIAAIGVTLTATSTAREMRLGNMKSEFVASVSHDLKTPLAKIQLYAETLESGRVTAPDKVEGYYRVISTQARKLAHLISELLDFSRIEAGVRRYPLQEVDLRAVLRAAIETFDQEFAAGRGTLEIALPDIEVPVLADPEAFEQVFENLISNAVKYSRGERFVSVTLSTTDGQALVEVTDCGIGIPRREQRKVFGKFYRGAEAVDMAVTGSGIGLAIVDNVARAHGGTVSVTSVPGQGSTFRVALPLVRRSTQAQDEADPVD